MNLKNKYGMFFSEKRIYKSNADYYFLAFNKKKYYSQNKILHFYLWDTHFKEIDTKDKYIDLLQKAKDKSIKYIVQSDFSCWYEFEQQRIDNIKKNFEYYKIANELGFEVLINFNTIFNDHFEYYKTIIKNKHFGVVIDGNHNDKLHKQKEINNFENLLKLTKIENLFIITGKLNNSILNEYKEIITICRQNNINITILPTEMVILRIKKKLFYK